jgi:16S rRNA (uracil1498-N3)-methyltransferase
VRRLETGDRIFLADGAGAHATGAIVRFGKKDADISIDDVVHAARPPAIHLLVPIADRDRMMWCAEKCAELGAASWTPVMWNRSRSVSPRGEGVAFAARIRARMTAALVQSRAPWLPEVRDDALLPAALSTVADGGTRLALDQRGTPISLESFVGPVTLAIGPEGGVEQSERELLRDAGFRSVSLGANVLRFETAAVAALAIVRSTLSVSPETTNG